MEVAPQSDFLRWIRTHPILFGMCLGVTFGLILLALVLCNPALADQVMTKNIGWVRFLTYTAGLFYLLAKYRPSRPPLFTYWTLFTTLLLLHSAFYFWVLTKIMALGAIHYIAYGPFEFLLLYFLLERGTQFLAKEPVQER